jgi:hypothetical protein
MERMIGALQDEQEHIGALWLHADTVAALIADAMP